MKISEANHRAIKTENAVLKTELRAAKKKIRKLEKQAARARDISLGKNDLTVLDKIAQFDLDEGAFPVQVSENLNLLKARMDYHLQRLVDGGYIEIVFVDPTLGENFVITQKGRKALVKKHLL
jgi:DNA-binding MarR family transcriptional regulator